MGTRATGRFERISWDEALDEIAARLQAIAAEFGSEAILPYSYAGTMGLLEVPAWTGVSSIGWARRASIEPSARRRAAPG